MIYETLDKVIISVLPKVAKYRELATGIVKDREDRTPKTNNMSKGALESLVKKKEKASFRAYWDVPAQYCLIHVDVFGLDSNSSKAKEAVAEIGRTFQWLKIADEIADEIVDEQKGSRYDNLKSMHDIITGYRSPKNPDEQLFIEEYNNLKLRDNNHVEKVFRHELAQSIADDTQRYNLRGNVGDLLGRVEYDILKKYLPNIPEYAEEFFASNGTAAAYFDDFKDFNLDREKNSGYKTDIRPKLLKGCIENTIKGLKVLKPKEKVRHLNFLMLGGLYQLREFLGFKERT